MGTCQERVAPVRFIRADAQLLRRTVEFDVPGAREGKDCLVLSILCDDPDFEGGICMLERREEVPGEVIDRAAESVIIDDRHQRLGGSEGGVGGGTEADQEILVRFPTGVSLDS